MDVALVSMPFAEVQRPSIALGLLKAALADSCLDCEVIYANFDFAEAIGLVTYQAIQASPADHLLGEWCFAEHLFSGAEDKDDEYLTSILEVRGAGFPPELAQRKDMVRWSRTQASHFLNRLADSIVNRKPRIVGCSSVFQQHCASLALLKRIRERSPDTVTLMGGANCEDEMGIEMLRLFPWIDCVVSGEADAFFRGLCELFVDKGLGVDPDALPFGVHTQSSLGQLPSNSMNSARSVLPSLDSLPIPDYDDYFAALEASTLKGMIQPGLMAESSRGCWWGERSHCTFCGLNGAGIAYRSKSPTRVLEELAELSGRYQLRNIQFVDNILDMSHIKSVLGELAKVVPRYSLFYETKANLKRPDVRALAEAGVYWIQPGIESLDNRVLKLLGKGNSALMNLQLLKWSRQYGINVSWNLLAGIPGEEDDWYLEMAEWLPAIFHLQPPSGVTRIRYDRFSPYQARPSDYCLELEPSRAYRYVYPLPTESLMRLAYFFEESDGQKHIHRAIQERPGIQQLQHSVLAWRQLWNRPSLPTLQVTSDISGLNVFDTRPNAPERSYRLGKKEAAVYRFCDVARNPLSIAKHLPEHEEAIKELLFRRLALSLNGKVLSLGLTTSESWRSLN